MYYLLRKNHVDIVSFGYEGNASGPIRDIAFNSHI